MSVLSSRFAVLSQDDDDDEGGGFTRVTKKGGAAVSKPGVKQLPQQSKPSIPSIPGLHVTSGATKKKKKRKGTGGTSASGGQHQVSKGSDNEDEHDQDGDVDLKEALQQSRLEFQKQTDRNSADDRAFQAALAASRDQGDDNYVHRKQKSVTLSLEEFQRLQAGDEAPTGSKKHSRNSASPPSFKDDAHPNGSFDLHDLVEEAEREARRIVIAEKQHADFAKTQPLESAIVAMYKTKLEEAQTKIVELDEENGKLKDERDKAKQRVQSLCKILNACEMKEKAIIQNELEKVSRVRDELTEEVNALRGQVEQSRSKIHELEAKLKK